MSAIASIDPRILGKRIAESRKARGKTQEQVADFLQCSRPTYIAIEKGDRPAKSDEILKLASYLGRSVHELVRPTEPVFDFQSHLRTAIAKTPGVEEGALLAGIDEFQKLVEDYRELEELTKSPLRFNYPQIATLNQRVDAEKYAESFAVQERQRLGLGDQPVVYLRSTLEWDVGLRIFYWELPPAIAGLYSYMADVGGCVLVNRRHPPERRRLSMAHAYARLIVDRHKPHLDCLNQIGRKSANGRFTEVFAMSWLMPANSVRQRFLGVVTTTGDFNAADLRRMSRFYFVSVESLSLRLEQLGLIHRRDWQFLQETKFSPLEAVEIMRSQAQPIHQEPFPERYKYLAVSAFERGDIGETDLASFLRCDIARAREIAAVTLSSREVDSAGEESAWRLDFSRSLLGATP